MVTLDYYITQSGGNIFRSLFFGLTLRYRKTIHSKYSAVAGVEAVEKPKKRIKSAGQNGF